MLEPGSVVEVRFLRIEGRSLTREEYASLEPVRGRIVVDDTPPGPGMMSFRAAAYLYEEHPTSPNQNRQLCRPLFDPEIKRWDRKGLVLQGYEINPNANMEAIQYVQIWLIQPVPA